MNKKIAILLILVLVVSTLSGCGSNKLPDGIESKTFFKDLNKLSEVIVKSFSTKTYKDKGISKILENMNQDEYKNELNNYELSILETINDVLPDIEKDLSSDNHTIKSETYDKIKWVLDIFEE